MQNSVTESLPSRHKVLNLIFRTENKNKTYTSSKLASKGLGSQGRWAGMEDGLCHWPSDAPYTPWYQGLYLNHF